MANNGTPVSYRRTFEFHKAFSLTNGMEKNMAALNVMVTNMGQEISLVTTFLDNALWARTLRVMGNQALSIASDGSLLLDDSSVKRYSFTFHVCDWGDDRKIVIPYSRHMVAEDNTIVVTVRGEYGYDLQCNVTVEEDGTVTIFTDFPFAGTAIIFGGDLPTSGSSMATSSLPTATTRHRWPGNHFSPASGQYSMVIPGTSYHLLIPHREYGPGQSSHLPGTPPHNGAVRAIGIPSRKGTTNTCFLPSAHSTTPVRRQRASSQYQTITTDGGPSKLLFQQDRKLHLGCRRFLAPLRWIITPEDSPLIRFGYREEG
jgi:hypothetical protein